MKLNLIVENKTYEENLYGEHGLALLIEADEKTILFDAGASDILVSNAKQMGIDLAKADLAMLSHGHYDHSGGFPCFHKINPHAKIHLQKNACKKTFEIDKKGKPTGENIGIRWTQQETKTLKPNLVFTEEPTYITENIVISGSIPEEMRETKTEQFIEKTGDSFADGSYVIDKMEHEQFLIIRENEKLYVFSGCSHSGVTPMIQYTKKLFPNNEIKLLFGGFHLYNSSAEQLCAEATQIIALGVEYLIPVHCTGLNAMLKMKELLGEKCMIMNAGEKLNL